MKTHEHAEYQFDGLLHLCLRSVRMTYMPAAESCQARVAIVTRRCHGRAMAALLQFVRVAVRVDPVRGGA